MSRPYPVTERPTPPVTLNFRQQRLAARIASARAGSTQNEKYNHPTSGALICRVIKKGHDQGQEGETMRWPCPDEEPAVKTVILSDDTAAMREAKRWVRERKVQGGAVVWMWWMDGSGPDHGRVRAATVYKHRGGWRASRSHLGTG